MADTKLEIIHDRFFDKTRRMLVEDCRLSHKLFVVTLGTSALFVEDSQKAASPFNKVQYVRVVIVCDFIKLDAFGLVLFLNCAKDVLSKLLLQLLVGIVDTELFETVHLEMLKAENVKQTDQSKVFIATTAVVLLGTCGIIDLAN